MQAGESPRPGEQALSISPSSEMVPALSRDRQRGRRPDGRPSPAAAQEGPCRVVAGAHCLSRLHRAGPGRGTHCARFRAWREAELHKKAVAAEQARPDVARQRVRSSCVLEAELQGLKDLLGEVVSRRVEGSGNATRSCIAASRVEAATRGPWWRRLAGQAARAHPHQTFRD